LIGLGVIEDLFETVFKNRKDRPTCFTGYMTHRLYETRTSEPSRVSSVYEDSLEQLLGDKKTHESGFDCSWDPEGQLKLGPLIESHYSAAEIAKRNKSSGYIKKLLLSSTELNCIEESRYHLENTKFTGISAILGPLSALLRCTYETLYRQILEDPSTTELFLLSMRELSHVISVCSMSLIVTPFSKYISSLFLQLFLNMMVLIR